MFSPINSHPIPFDLDEIEASWPDHEQRPPPSVDEAHKEYVDTIAVFGPWSVFRVLYPFGTGNQVIFWNQEFGEGVTFSDQEGSWHTLVSDPRLKPWACQWTPVLPTNTGRTPLQ